MWKAKHESWCNDGTKLLQTGTYYQRIPDNGNFDLDNISFKPIKTICATCFAPAKWIEPADKVPKPRAAGRVTLKKLYKMLGATGYVTSSGMELTSPSLVVSTLKTPDGKPEVDSCYDVSGKGSSASDIIIKRHSEEVFFRNADNALTSVADAVEQWKKEHV